jgi:hypothetical protein
LASNKGGKRARGDVRDLAKNPCHCDALASRGIARSNEDGDAVAHANATGAATTSGGCGDVYLPIDRDCSQG